MGALKQGVMKLSRNSCAFADTRIQGHLKLVMQALHAVLVSRPQEQQKRGRTQPAKPVCLVVRRRNRELQSISLLVPHAAVVARDHAKAVRTWWEIRVLHLADVDHLSPVAILVDSETSIAVSEQLICHN